MTETGKGGRGTRNRERESGNECTAVTRVKIQHGGQEKRKGSNLGKCEEVLRLLTRVSTGCTTRSWPITFLLEQSSIGSGINKA